MPPSAAGAVASGRRAAERSRAENSSSGDQRAENRMLPGYYDTRVI